MKKEIFYGIIIGAVLMAIVGWGVLEVSSLNTRITIMENFLNNVIKQNQQRQVPPTETKPAGQ